MFHLAVVLEERRVIARGLYAQHDAMLVIHFDQALAEAVLVDAGVLDSCGELRADLLLQQRRDLPAQESGDLPRLRVQHPPADQLLVERLSVAVERNARSVAYSTCVRLQW
jgi:hypothetical protein